MSIDHYENFPVASLLLPSRLREPVRDIYRFARTADDIADEGNAPNAERLANLARYRDTLQQIQQGRLTLADNDPLRAVFEPLALSIAKFSLPLQPFFDLLSAFEQDVVTQRYADDAALLDYCSRSANPVGRLMLHLYQAVTPENLTRADLICTGLQLTNFWQDIAIDLKKSRIYLPQEKLRQHDVCEDTLGQSTDAQAWQALMRGQIDQARRQLKDGLPLADTLGGRIGFELRLVVQGGLRILERLDQLHYDVFRRRPTLRKSDWALLFWRALR